MKLINSFAAAICVASIAGHSNLHNPRPRGNARWSSYCSRGQGCETACDAPKAASNIDSPYSAKKVIKRGQTLEVSWLRQNHPGGFVRLAMVPFDQSDDSTAFDKHVFHYSCYETDCREDRHEDFLGKNNGSGTQSCTTKFTVPKSIPNGKVTMQWTWYGGGIYFAQKDTSFAHYVSCADMIVEGDEPVENAAIQPTFDSRDKGAGLNGQCRYWSSNSIFGCPKGSEDDEHNKVNRCGFTGEQFGAPSELNQMAQSFGAQSSGITTPTKPQPPVSSPTPEPSKSQTTSDFKPPVFPQVPGNNTTPSPAPSSVPAPVPVPVPTPSSVTIPAPSPSPSPSPSPVDQQKQPVPEKLPTPTPMPENKPSTPTQPESYNDVKQPQSQKPVSKSHPKKCHSKITKQ